MSLRRTLSPAYFNEVANHPEVSKWLFADGPIDLSEIIENPANFALQADGGGFLVVKLHEAIYEVHSLFLPDARSGTVKAMADGMAYMFTRTDCHRLVTKVPVANVAAGLLAAKGGFRRNFVRNDAKLGETAYLVLDIDDWIQTNDDLVVGGHWFHSALEEAKSASRSTRLTHPDDIAHDRAVGAAIEMLRAGQIGKALGSYNRWAAFSGYLPISLVSTAPVTLDVGDAVIELNNGNLEVIACRYTPAEYDRYSEAAGKGSHDAVSALIATPRWSKMVPDAQRKAIKTAIDKARDVARGGLVADGPVNIGDGDWPGQVSTKDNWPGKVVDQPDVMSDLERIVPGLGMTSGFRTPEYQAAMKRRGYHPADNSGHLDGSSLDLVPPRGKSIDWLRVQVKRYRPDARLLNEGDHLHATFPGWYGAPVLGGAKAAGLSNPMEGQR